MNVKTASIWRLFDVDNTEGVRPDKSFIKNTCDEKSKKEQDKIIKNVKNHDLTVSTHTFFPRSEYVVFIKLLDHCNNFVLRNPKTPGLDYVYMYMYKPFALDIKEAQSAW